MRIIFLGVGEAFDENYPNNSALVFSAKTSLMIDCGDSAVRQLWKFNQGNHNLPDALYITHRHSDHLFGLPAMLGRFHEEKRTNPFTIICTKAMREDVKVAASYAYSGLETNFPFDLEILEVEDGESVGFHDMKLSFASARHSTPVFAIRVEHGGKSFCYSGDGMFSLREGFYAGLDLLTQETYLYDKEIIGHACVTGAVKFAEENSIKTLALVHLNKHFRKNDLPKVRDQIKSDKVRVIIPEPMDETQL
ncbi:MAG: ribonuclease Z [Candidatus Staskawiczbacteria bacterium]|nr:ribonuclease Z [Candidatus Staskawiczbacteria bacterium]